ncbi:hypothetical protein AVEN_49974-1 [Araneus ventricosus]|uniref:Uncharacterized protein n=1 Tax=Araneus ventricosus TaxID=182803 RepID=A0A4Y2WDT1_ARAVE|nr:hypothetical protein AVEN_49974-1 [Araneus ventricosus]
MAARGCLTHSKYGRIYSSSAAMLEDSSEGQITPRFKRSKASQTIDKISRRMDQLLEKQPAIKPKEEHEIFEAYAAEKLIDQIWQLFAQK